MNNIESISGLETCKQLYSLNLSSNRISVVSGLEKCKKLTILDLSENEITKVSPSCWGLRELPCLNDLDLSRN